MSIERRANINDLIQTTGDTLDWIHYLGPRIFLPDDSPILLLSRWLEKVEQELLFQWKLNQQQGEVARDNWLNVWIQQERRKEDGILEVWQQFCLSLWGYLEEAPFHLKESIWQSFLINNVSDKATYKAWKGVWKTSASDETFEKILSIYQRLYEFDPYAFACDLMTWIQETCGQSLLFDAPGSVDLSDFDQIVLKDFHDLWGNAGENPDWKKLPAKLKQFWERNPEGVFLKIKSDLLYFDGFSGVSGDMCLAALVDAGADEGFIKNQLLGLNLEKFAISFHRVMKKGVSALKLQTDAESVSAHSRNYTDIKSMIEKSDLDDQVKTLSLKIFEVLAVAEAKIHGVDIGQVHFHEVGALDSILDIIGTAAAIVDLKPDKIISSPIKLGSGTVEISHGTYPVPAMATLEILKGVPIEHSKIEKELTTPTGAAIIKVLSEEYSRGLPDMIFNRSGFGAGSMDLVEQPNVLRIVVGKQ